MKIKTYGDCGALLMWDWRDISLTTADFEALREYFQAERDEQLDRWRDPENPDYVAYPGSINLDWVVVLDESTGGTDVVFRQPRKPTKDSDFRLVADRYFATHLDPEPRPWEAAKPGEVWVLTRWGTAEPFLVTGGEFVTADLAVIVDLDDDSITAGRRVWPEGEDK